MKSNGTLPRGFATQRRLLSAIAFAILGVASSAGMALAQPAQPASAAATGAHSSTAPDGAVKVLAAHPVVYALALVLTQDSGIVLERAAPGNLPPTRMASYFAGRGAKQLARAASGADAVIGLRSIWPDDPLYPLARRSNIRIVEIDAARPVDGALPGVALQANSDMRGYPWLNPVNLGRMADVIATDLERLAPSAQPALQGNLAGLKRSLVALAADAEARLVQLDDVSVASLSERLDYLVSGLNLDMALRDARPDEEWSQQALNGLRAELEALDVKVVLHHREPAENIRQAVADAGARLVVLDTEQEDTLGQLEAMVQDVLQGFRP